MLGFGSRRRPRAVVIVFDDAVEDETVAGAGYGADEARLPRVVLERATDGPHRLAERAVGDDDVAPDAVEDVAPVHRLVPVLDEEDEKVEVARDERLLGARGPGH